LSAGRATYFITTREAVMDAEDVAKVALVAAVVGALLFILSNNPDVDTVGWTVFVIGLIVAAVAALIAVLSHRRH
jgi:undecaprenyl pyrophosphate phosphatase UppP